MSKRMYRHVLVLPSRRLVHPATDDDFEIQVKNTSSRLGGYLVHFLAQAWKNQKPL